MSVRMRFAWHAKFRPPNSIQLSSVRQYWSFYWPLALTGVGLVLSMQFQNATLARYPEAVRELATIALAYGVYGFFNAGLQFISQLTNVYARSAQALARTRQFVWLAGIIITLPLFLIAATPIGEVLVRLIFGIDATLADAVGFYLILKCPLILLNSHRHMATGLLIQAHLTGWVTISNFIYLGVVITGLIAGFAMGLAPPYVIVGSEVIGVVVLLVTLQVIKRRHYALPELAEHEHVTYLELTKFFIPVSMTGIMFALSRPILYAFVARSPNSIAVIAALRITFDFTMLFQQAANQFRHFFISFGFDDLRAKIQFMAVVCAGITLLMLVFVLTALSDFIWGTVMGIPEELITLALEALLVMCLMPIAIIYRNYFHSRLMTLRRTEGMAYGSMARVASIFLLAALLQAAGMLTHISAAGILVFSFVVEAFISQWFHGRLESA